MKSKILRMVLVAVFVAMVVGGLTGCDLANLFLGDAAKRIQSFADDVESGDWDNVNSNFHPTETDQYYQMDPSYWDGIFPSDDSYEFSAIVGDDDSNTGTATLTVNGSVDYQLAFTFAEYGSELRIKAFSGFGAVVIKQILGDAPATRE